MSTSVNTICFIHRLSREGVIALEERASDEKKILLQQVALLQEQIRGTGTVFTLSFA